MTTELFINNCIFLGLPLMGLITGAMVAPHLYHNRKSLSIKLNVLGFLLYLIPLCVVLGAYATHLATTPFRLAVETFLKGLFFILFIFAGVEVFTIMHLLRRIDRNG